MVSHRNFRFAIGSWSLLCCALPAMSLSARAEAGTGYAEVALADSGNVSRDQVIAAVQKRFNAKVVRVTETTVNGRSALELRLLSDQRVWDVVVDADSGQVLSGG